MLPGAPETVLSTCRFLLRRCRKRIPWVCAAVNASIRTIIESGPHAFHSVCRSELFAFAGPSGTVGPSQARSSTDFAPKQVRLAPAAAAIREARPWLHAFGKMIPALLVERGHELDSAVDSDGLHLERHLADDLAEELRCVASGGSPAGFGVSPFGDEGDGDRLLDGSLAAPVEDGRAVEVADVSDPLRPEPCEPPLLAPKCVDRPSEALRYRAS